MQAQLKKLNSAEANAEESYNAAKIARLEKEGQVSGVSVHTSELVHLWYLPFSCFANRYFMNGFGIFISLVKSLQNSFL